MKTKFYSHLLLLSCLLLTPITRADEPGVVDRTKEAVKNAADSVSETTKDAKTSVEDAGKSAAKSFEDLWRRVDEGRLKNRTRDEIGAWAMIGVMVGAVAGMFTSLKSSGLGKVGRLLLGLAGAFIGGIVVHAARINFGWGPVMIRYEELLFAFIGAIVLVGLGRLIRKKSIKQPAEK